MVAIHCGVGAAQHFHAFGHIQVEGGGLALAVRHAGRDAVGDQLDTAYAEGRAGAEAAGGDLQVLGVVLAVVGHHAGDGDEGFGGIHPGLAGGDLFPVEHVDGGGQVEAGGFGAAAGDHHRVEGEAGVVGSLGQAGAPQGGGKGGVECGGERGRGEAGRHDDCLRCLVLVREVAGARRRYLLPAIVASRKS